MSKFSLLAGGLALAALAVSAKAETLMVYTSQPVEQMTSVIELFNKTTPDVKVELFRSGTTEIMNKLQAELAGGDPKADVLLIADSIAMTAVKNEGLLMAYKEAPVKDLDASQYDKDMTFFGTKLITTGLIYNTASGKPRPASWMDLLKPEAKGQVIMPSPLYSGAATIHVGTLAAQAQFGWSYFEKLAANGAIAAKGNGSVRDAVARGEKAYGVIVEYMAYAQKAKGSPVEFVFPKEGITAINQPVAILKNARHVAAAKKFVDFQLSKAAQEQSVGQMYFPLVKGVAPPAGYPDPSTLKIIDADANFLLKSDEETKRKFASIFGG